MVATMDRKMICETVAQAASITEDVESYGLDSDLYVAVFPAELGRGGVVNANNRIYAVEGFLSENNRLAGRVAREFVDGEAGHPAGASTFDVPVRLVNVSVESDGETALARGAFAVLNTQIGRDVMTLHQAGMSVGVSSRGTGMLSEHLIDEDSPYWGSNPSYRGNTVDEVTDFELLTYDLVRAPSADTHVQPATQEAQEAYARLCESGYLEVSPRTEENIVAKKDAHVDVPAPVDTATENGAEEKGALDEERIVQEARDAAVEAVRISDPFSALTENQKATLMRLACVVESAEEEKAEDDVLAEQVKRVADQAEVDRQRLAEAEEMNAQLLTKLRSLEETIESERREKAISDAISAAVGEAPHGARIRGELEALVTEGRITTADGVSVWATRLNSLVEGVESDRRNATGDAIVEAADASDDLVPETADERTIARGPGLLDENFADTLRNIIDKDRAHAGRV